MSDNNATGRTTADLFYEIFFKHRGMKIALVIIALISLSVYLYLQYKSGHNDPSSASTLSISPGGRSNTGKSTMTLTGVVKDEVTHTPVAGLAVFIKANGKTAYTDNEGRYTLTLDSVNYTAGDAIVVYTDSKEYGAHETTALLSADDALNFSIPRDADTKFVVGLVRDAQTGEPIPGIAVTAQAEETDINVDPVLTDSFGTFKIQLSKLQLHNKRDVRILLNDPAHRYLTSEPGLQNTNSYLTLPMTKRAAPSMTLKVRGYIRTRISVHSGHLVEIEADGNITLGTFVGTSGPDGRESGVMNMSLKQYNIVGHINHGALMYRLEGDLNWHVAGKKVRFIPAKDGVLEFQINDNKQSDNEGAFNVQVNEN